jgi:2-dehydro-3-deoxyglucarate aldolase/4-hydroxy-2-oxoheptanedioate aldolase
MNAVKRKLTDGGIVLGQMALELFTPGYGPMLAAAGAEFVIFDMEHGRCDLALAAELIASCRGTPIVPIVRVPDSRQAPLSRVLDLGARGVMIPRVATRAEMEHCIAELKYPPRGRRGVALGIAHDLYQPGSASFFEDANEDVLIIAILETVQAFENLEAIVSTPGLDVAWMGHYDLTTSMGIPGQFDHPRFLEAMDALVAACVRHDVAPGFLPATPPDAIRWIRKGFRAISLGSDIGVFINAVRGFRAAVLEGTATQGGATA